LSEIIQYVYCVVPAGLPASDAPPGIDRTPVTRVACGGLAALASALDATEYSSDLVSARTDDPAWLTPRAVAHDALVTWVADVGAVVPFPMWVMFGDEAGVAEMLAREGHELRETLERVTGAKEFGVRLSGSQQAVATAAETMDAALAALEQQASVASPGQAYLLRRKLAEVRKVATRDAAVRIAEETHDALSGCSRASMARATTLANEPGVLLDGAYLVADEAYAEFRTVLTAIIAAYEPAGIRIDFTGPWPPYHFVRGS
jgi:hypothetical protein